MLIASRPSLEIYAPIRQLPSAHCGPNLPDKVDVVTKSKLNGGTNVIARTSSNIVFQRGQPAFALLDYDTKGMPKEVDQAIKRAGGFWGALLTVLPELQTVAHV